MEPTDDNPAVVAAHFGHTEVVHELLESLPGKVLCMSSITTGFSSFAFLEHNWKHILRQSFRISFSRLAICIESYTLSFHHPVSNPFYG